MKVVFMGTSVFAVPALKSLLEAGYEVAAVITQPDRPWGRGKKITYSPVKIAAQELSLPIYQFERIKQEEAYLVLEKIRPQIIIVAAYGQIIPPAILSLPDRGCINIHASLLPNYRGAAPIQRALMAGEKITGITTMLMDSGLDTGDILLQSELEIDENEDCGRLQERMAVAGANLLIDTLRRIEAQDITPRKQDDKRATYAAMLTGQDELLDWKNSAINLHNQIRALNPQPGAYTRLGGSKLKIYRSRVMDTDSIKGQAGEILAITPDGFNVQARPGVIELLEVQRENKKRMKAKDFLAGFSLQPGDRIG